MIARSRVLSSRPETPTTHSVRLEKPLQFTFAPVQFVGLEFETDEGSIEYSMSIASSPTKDYIEFGARISDSPWKRAFRALKPGDVTEIDGPYGHFILDESRPAVLIAGGVGITPLKGMMEYATDRHLPMDLALVYSSRSPEEIMYKGVLDELSRRNRRIDIVYTVTQLEAGAPWEGRRGRIDEAMLREAAGRKQDPAYYLCGKPEMVKGMIKLLRRMGISPRRILEEQFWGYE